MHWHALYKLHVCQPEILTPGFVPDDRRERFPWQPSFPSVRDFLSSRFSLHHALSFPPCFHLRHTNKTQISLFSLDPFIIRLCLTTVAPEQRFSVFLLCDRTSPLRVLTLNVLNTFPAHPHSMLQDQIQKQLTPRLLHRRNLLFNVNNKRYFLLRCRVG